jgi:hypothetical protein
VLLLQATPARADGDNTVSAWTDTFAIGNSPQLFVRNNSSRWVHVHVQFYQCVNIITCQPSGDADLGPGGTSDFVPGLTQDESQAASFQYHLDYQFTDRAPFPPGQVRCGTGTMPAGAQCCDDQGHYCKEGLSCGFQTMLGNLRTFTGKCIKPSASQQPPASTVDMGNDARDLTQQDQQSVVQRERQAEEARKRGAAKKAAEVAASQKAAEERAAAEEAAREQVAQERAKDQSRREKAAETRQRAEEQRQRAAEELRRQQEVAERERQAQLDRVWRQARATEASNQNAQQSVDRAFDGLRNTAQTWQADQDRLDSQRRARDAEEQAEQAQEEAASREYETEVADNDRRLDAARAEQEARVRMMLADRAQFHRETTESEEKDSPDPDETDPEMIRAAHKFKVLCSAPRSSHASKTLRQAKLALAHGHSDDAEARLKSLTDTCTAALFDLGLLNDALDRMWINALREGAPDERADNFALTSLKYFTSYQERSGDTNAGLINLINELKRRSDSEAEAFQSRHQKSEKTLGEERRALEQSTP